jgi:hypothetical protein
MGMDIDNRSRFKNQRNRGFKIPDVDVHEARNIARTAASVVYLASPLHLYFSGKTPF